MRRRKGPHRQPARPAPAAAKPESTVPTPPRDYRPGPPLVCLFLVFGVLLAFSPACAKDAEFLRLDDGDYVTENPHVNTGLTADNVAWAFTTYHSSNWHPLTWLSLQLDYDLFGLEAWGFHLTSILLHAAAAVTLFLVLHQMTSAFWRSALVAALFAIHPLRVESVAWAAERKDVLSALFWMLTMAAYVWYVAAPSVRRYLAVTAFFVLGLMAKPMVVTLPCVLLLLDYWPLRRWIHAPGADPAKAASLWHLVREKLPWFALAAGGCVLTVLAQGEAIVTLDLLPFPMRLLNAFLSYAGYIGKSLWPAHLCPFYSHPTGWLPIGEALAAGGALVAVSILAVLWAKRRPYLIVGWLWFLGTLVPVIGLIQVGMQNMADRYTYIPQIGLWLMLVWGLAELVMYWAWPPPVLAAGAGAIVAASFFATDHYARYWQYNVPLWEHAVEVTDDNFAAHYHLAVALMAATQVENDPKLRDKLTTEAVEHFRESLRLEPKYMTCRFHLASALEAQQHWAEAEELFADLVHRVPDSDQAWHELGVCRMQQDKNEEATVPLENAVRLKPDFGTGHFNLATAYFLRGRNAESKSEMAIAMRMDRKLKEGHNRLGLLLAMDDDLAGAAREFETTLHIPSEDAGTDAAALCYLAWVHQTQDKSTEAKDEYGRAVQAMPGLPKALRKRAWPLATHSDGTRRNGKLALLWARILCQDAAPRDPESLDLLAAAYAEVGRFPDAVAAAKQALTAAVEQPELASAIEKRLRLYEKGEAYREEKSGDKP